MSPTVQRSRSRGSWALILIGWLAVVGVGSALVWSVISRAGQQVGDPTEAAALQITATTSATPGGKPHRGPSPSAHPSAPASSASSTPTTSATHTVTPAPTGATHTPQPASPVRRTWQGALGSLVVECTGSRIRLVGAQADSGVHVEVEDRGPDRVRVRFESVGEDGAETDVRSECSGGAPVFSEQHDG